MNIRSMAVILSALLVACVRPGGSGAAVPVPLIEVCDTIPREMGTPALIPAAPVQAGAAGLVGVVVDPHTGTAVPRASVRLSGGLQMGAISDSAGGFVIRSVREGRYRLFAAKLGYRGRDTTVVLKRGRVDTVRIALRVEACGMLDSDHPVPNAGSLQ